MRQVIGIDIGGVIIDRINDNTDTSFFGDNYLRTTLVPGALETIRRLLVFENDDFLRTAHLISKCGQRVEEKNMVRPGSAGLPPPPQTVSRAFASNQKLRLASGLLCTQVPRNFPPLILFFAYLVYSGCGKWLAAWFVLLFLPHGLLFGGRSIFANYFFRRFICERC